MLLHLGPFITFRPSTTFSLPKADSELLPAKIPNLFKSIAIAITHSITSRQQFSHK